MKAIALEMSKVEQSLSAAETNLLVARSALLSISTMHESVKDMKKARRADRLRLRLVKAYELVSDTYAKIGTLS